VRQFATFVIAVTIAVAALPGSASAAGCPGADRRPGATRLDEARAATKCLLNRERAKHGLRPLRSDGRLAAAARRHGADMVRHRYFAHDSRGGGSFVTRIRAAGYMSGARRWTVGENLAWGAFARATPRSIVAAWMASPPHRHNILNGRFAEIGLAVVKGAPVAAPSAATYVTELGRRS
jgi:uncharacterized protein YkwD